MWKYAALISYNGTNFCGWQKQQKDGHEKKHSIQQTIESVVERMTGETLSVVGSGRTDAGVHAAGQVAHFILKKKEWDPRILMNGMNSLLRHSVQVLGVQPVPIEFHAQRSAEKKQYSYYFQQGPAAMPYLEPYSWWIRKRLDLEAMQQAIQALVGEHDYKPFQASGAKPGPTVRRILDSEVSLEEVRFPGLTLVPANPVRLVRVRVIGTGFLKQMVRGIAGTLLQVGENRRESSCIREILEAQDRRLVGPTAPARALWLERVWYPGLDW